MQEPINFQKMMISTRELSVKKCILTVKMFLLKVLPGWLFFWPIVDKFSRGRSCQATSTYNFLARFGNKLETNVHQRVENFLPQEGVSFLGYYISIRIMQMDVSGCIFRGVSLLNLSDCYKKWTKLNNT